MSFDAAGTSPLDYIFRDAEGAVTVSGTIPDPTEAKVREFNSAIASINLEARRAIAEIADTATDDLAALEQRREKVADVERQLHDRQLDAIAELCSGKPSREQVDAQPYRVQVGFIAWLTQELRDPTTLPATRPPLAAVR